MTATFTLEEINKVDNKRSFLIACLFFSLEMSEKNEQLPKELYQWGNE